MTRALAPSDSPPGRASPPAADATSAPRSEPSRGISLPLFWLFGVALLIPVWASTHFPSEDGLAHLAWTEVYRALGSPGSAWEPYYARTAQWNTPNLAYFGLQYALGGVVDPHLAQRLILSMLILGWVASVHVLSVQLSGRVTLGAFASLLLIQSSWLYGGYLGFLVGVPPLLLALAVVARVLRSGRPPGGSVVTLLAAIGVVTYYAHLTTASMFLVLVAMAVAFGVWRNRGRLDRTAAALAAGATPAALLVLTYLAADSLGSGGMRWEPIQKTIARLAGFAFFRGFAAPDLLFWGALAAFAGLMLVFGLDVLRGLRKHMVPRIGRFVLGAAAVLLFLYLVAPDGVGDGYNLKGRFQLVLWAWLLPTLPYALSRQWHVALSAVIAALLVWQIADFTARARRFDPEYDAVVAQVRELAPGSTIDRELAYERAAFNGSFIKVLAHAPEELAYHCGCVLVDGYHPSTSFYWVATRRESAAPGARYHMKLQQLPAAPISLTLSERPAASGDAPSAGSPATARRESSTAP